MTVKPTIPVNYEDNHILLHSEWNNEIEAEARYCQEVVAGTNSDKIPLAAFAQANLGQYKNFLVNPGWEQWNRGATSYLFTTTETKYTADRWAGSLTVGSGAQAQVYRYTGIEAGVGSQYSCAVAYTHASGAAFCLYQPLPDRYTQFRGLTMTFTVRITGTLAVLPGIFDDVSPTDPHWEWGTAYTPGTGWQTVSVQRTVRAGAVKVYPGLYIASGSGAQSFVVDNAQWYVGTNAAIPTFQPLPYEEELRACRRYFQTVECSARFESHSATEYDEHHYQFGVPMAAAPATTLTASAVRGNVGAAGVATLPAVDANGLAFYVQTTGAAPLDTYSYGDKVAVECTAAS